MVKIKLKQQPDAKEAERLAKQLNTNETIAALLIQRGFADTEKARRFLYSSVDEMSDPYALSGMREAADAIRDAIAAHRKIVIFGDYDCDGIGAVAILYLTLKKMNANVGYFIPERKNDGYGISWSALTRLFEQDQADLIVSVDCGISSYREIAKAKSEFGAEFVVTDHHELPDTLPDAILVNPHFGSETEFCGAGVALKLSEALLGRSEALRFADICCLSTIADVVPLTGENRILVKEGLNRFAKRDIRTGLQELLKVSGIENGTAVTSYDIAFKLAPRINASGRLDSALKSLELLIGQDRSELRLIAESLNEDNLIRQQKTEEVISEAREKLRSYDISEYHAIVLQDTNWDSGVLGIAAARIAESYRRPTVLMTEKDGNFTGSARSVSGINLYDMLAASSGLLLKFGGHAAAAGLSVAPQNLDAFRLSCKQYLEDKTDLFSNLGTVYADFAVSGDENVAFYKELEKLEPYGMGNPKPLILWDKHTVWSRINTKPHLKSSVSADTELLAFRKGDMLEFWNTNGGKFVVAPEVKVFRNRARASLTVKHYEESDTLLSDDVLLIRYLRNHLLKVSDSAFEKRKPNGKFGKLYIVFTGEAFRRAKEQYPLCEAFQMRSDHCSPQNAIVLSPDENTDFSSYNEIVFLEKPPHNFLQYVSNATSAVVSTEGSEPKFRPIRFDVTALRRLYVLFCKKLNGQILTSQAELWMRLFQNDCERFEFEIAYAVFEETGLLNADKNGIIHIINKKTDLNESFIFRSINAAT